MAEVKRVLPSGVNKKKITPKQQQSNEDYLELADTIMSNNRFTREKIEQIQAETANEYVILQKNLIETHTQDDSGVVPGVMGEFSALTLKPAFNNFADLEYWVVWTAFDKPSEFIKICRYRNEILCKLASDQMNSALKLAALPIGVIE